MGRGEQADSVRVIDVLSHFFLDEGKPRRVTERITKIHFDSFHCFDIYSHIRFEGTL